MAKNDWHVTKKGWPDFFCTKNGSLVLVEVKPSKDDPLSPEQIATLTALAGFGIHCYLWIPGIGFERIASTYHPKKKLKRLPKSKLASNKIRALKPEPKQDPYSYRR